MSHGLHHGGIDTNDWFSEMLVVWCGCMWLVWWHMVACGWCGGLWLHVVVGGWCVLLFSCVLCVVGG